MNATHDRDSVGHPFTELLTRLGYAPGDQIVIGMITPGDPGGMEVRLCTDPEQAARIVASHQDRHVFLNVNAMARIQKGRGTADDVTRVSALIADLDFKNHGLRSEIHARAVIDDLSTYLGTPPAVVVNSGGGLHPYWLLAEAPVDDVLRQQMARWRTLVELTADTHGGHVDNIFDLPRMLRAPGSFNHKHTVQRDVTAEFADPGSWEPLMIADLSARLDEAGIETPPEEAAHRATQSSSADWPEPSESTCGYVTAMVSGWATDSPTNGRHPWVVSQCVRLACALRLGCVTAEDRDLALTNLTGRFRELITPDGDRHRIAAAPWEVKQACCWAIQRVESLTDEQCRAELGSHEHADPSESDMGEADSGFWGSRPILSHIRDYARFRLVSPWALLACVLARTAAEISPDVVIPPIVGAKASLNLYVVLVGMPGAGKSTAMSASEEMRNWTTNAFDLGSAEGLIDQYASIRRKPDDDDRSVRNSTWDSSLVLHRARGIAVTDELKAFLEQADRRGSLILPSVLALFTGGKVHPAYRNNKTYLPAHEVRFCWIVGAQYATAGAVFEKADLGLPQRFVWCTTNDPMAADGCPEPPGHMPWNVPEEVCGNTSDALVLKFDKTIVNEVRRNRVAVLKSEPNAEAGHDTLVRLKVAALMGLLDGRVDITLEDWSLAGHIMDHSARQLTRVQEHRKREADERLVSGGRKQATRESAQERATQSRIDHDAAGAMSRAVHKHVNPADPNDGFDSRRLKDFIGKRLRKHHHYHFHSALEVALSKGWIVATTRPRKDHSGREATIYRRGPSRPD